MCYVQSPKSLRSSMGFGLRLPVLQLSWPEVIRGLIGTSSPTLHGGNGDDESARSSTSVRPGQTIYLADNAEDSIPYYECDFVRPFVLVIGSEAEGISDEVSSTTSG